MENSETRSDKEENQTTTPVSSINPAILEAFDGDLDDWMDWNKKVSFMEQEAKDGLEASEAPDEDWMEDDETEEDEIESGGEEQPQMDIDAATAVAGNGDNTSEQVGNTEKLHRIDLSDPHYANYEPDMYYEYGIGPEPKKPSPREIQGGISGLAVASLSCSIAGIVLICCGYGFPLSIASIVMGIITLCKKRPFDSNKVMALIAVILSLIEIIGYIIYLHVIISI